MRSRTSRVSFIEAFCMFFASSSLLQFTGCMNGERIVTISVHVGDETLAHLYCYDERISAEFGSGGSQMIAEFCMVISKAFWSDPH